MADVLDIELDKELFEKSEFVICTASTGSGKTYLIEQLVKKYSSKFYRIMVVGSKNELLNFPETRHKTEYYTTNRNDHIYNPFLEVDHFDVKKNKDKQFLIIYDDLLTEVHKSPIISDIFMKGRHLNISCILLMQTYFPSTNGKSLYPQIKNNSTIQIFLKLRSVSEIKLISRRLEHDKVSQNFFCNLYKQVVQNVKYGYLVVFMDTSNEKLRYGTNLLDEDGSNYLTVYSE